MSYSIVPGCSLYTRRNREGVGRVAALLSPQWRQVSVAFSVATTAREVRYQLWIQFFSLFSPSPVSQFCVIFVFVSSNRLMCAFWRVLYAITTKVTHVFVRGKRACRSLSFCRADSGSTVRLLYIPIILLLPASAPNAKNIKASQFDREMSFHNWPVSITGNVKLYLLSIFGSGQWRNCQFNGRLYRSRYRKWESFERGQSIFSELRLSRLV